jgi:hypothetical protein
LVGQNKQKGRVYRIKLSFGSSAIFGIEDPPLSVPPLREVWFCRDFELLFLINITDGGGVNESALDVAGSSFA